MLTMLNKKEAADYLGVSTRTIELYMKHEQRPLVPDERRPGRGGDQPYFTPETLDAYKELMQQEAERAAVKRESPKPETAKDALALRGSRDLVSLLASVIRPQTKLVTRRQAAQESGLSVATIEKAIKAGALREMKGIGPRGASVMRLSDVLAYASGLFDGPDAGA